MTSSGVDILVKAVASLATNDPGIVRVWSLVNAVVDKHLDVAYRASVSNDRLLLRYNPELLGKLGNRMVSRFFYMECVRLLLGHYGKRKKPDMTICKLASDIISGTLSLVHIPPDENEDRTLIDMVPTYANYETMLASHGIRFPNINFDLEHIYEALLQENMSGVAFAGPDTDDADDDTSQEAQTDDPGKEICGDDGENSGENSGGGNNAGLSVVDDTNTDGNTCPADGSDGSVSAETGCSSVGRDCDDGDGTEAAPAQVVRDLFNDIPGDGTWDGTDDLTSMIYNVVTELNKSGEMDKLLPDGDFRNEINAQFSGLVKRTSRVLRRFTASIMSSHCEETWNRPSRRYDDEMPGLRHVCRPNVLLCVDVSGSMNINVQRVINLLKCMLKAFDLDVCFWNTAVTAPVHANVGILHIPVSHGGTRPDVVLDMVRERRLHYDGFVFVTDCNFIWPVPKEAKKIAIIRVGEDVVFFGHNVNEQCRYDFPVWCHYAIDDMEVGL